MDSTQIDREHLIERFLAGQLPPNESGELERNLCEQPDLRERTEQILRFKEGLARLHERGELDALLQPSAPRRWLPYAAAAAVVIAALGALIWVKLPSAAAPLLARSPGEFAAHQRAAPPILGTYVLVRTRGVMPITDLRAVETAGVIELRALPSVLSPAARYTVQVRHLDGPSSGAIAGQIDAGAASPDGYVTIYLNGPLLKPGSYEVSLVPSAATGTNTETDRFVIRVR